MHNSKPHEYRKQNRPRKSWLGRSDMVMEEGGVTPERNGNFQFVDYSLFEMIFMKNVDCLSLLAFYAENMLWNISLLINS